MVKSFDKGDLVERVVCVNRTSKVLKGGTVFSFSALVVVGNSSGYVGYGMGKAKEVTDAKKKATAKAKKSMIYIPLREGRAIHHDVIGKYGAARVMLRYAPSGRGVIAGGAMRAVFESLGVKDIVAKSLGSSRPSSLIRATFNALSKVESPKFVANRRGKRTAEVISQIAIRDNSEYQNDDIKNEEQENS